MDKIGVKKYIRTIKDFPHEGIMFRDVTSLFADPNGFDLTLTGILSSIENIKIDKVLGIEARGFILGGALANRLHCGFVPIRKSGKLPGAIISQDYQLEYGSDTLEIHVDSIEPGEKVLLVDDLLATGGTAEAGVKLIEKLGGNIVSCNFIVNLPKLGGDKKLLCRPLKPLFNPDFIRKVIGVIIFVCQARLWGRFMAKIGVFFPVALHQGPVTQVLKPAAPV